MEYWEIHVSGEPVKELQRAINTYYGYQKLTVDGFFGRLTETACPTLNKGNVNACVGVIQRRLKSKGYYSGQLDNCYGPATSAAMYQYQVYRGVSNPDGICTSIWYHALFEILG